MSYWTGRFESKHRVAKSTAESAKNVINVTKTISERQQMRAASVFYRGMFNFAKFSLPETVVLKQDINETSSFHITLKTFMSNDDFICNEIFVNNQTYKNDDLIVLEVTDCDNIAVGLIQTILVKNDKVYFVTKKYLATRSCFNYFESNISETTPVFTLSSSLADFKPLIKRGSTEKFVFVLHHHISFLYQ